MKTTIDLPDELLIAAKKKAAEERTSLKALVTRGLHRELESEKSRGSREGRPMQLPTVDGGLPPGLDLGDRAAMHAWFHTRS